MTASRSGSVSREPRKQGKRPGAKKVGRLLNADKFIFVTVSRTGGISMVDSEEQFVVRLDVNDIESGVVEVSATETNGTNALYPALNKMIS